MKPVTSELVNTAREFGADKNLPLEEFTRLQWAWPEKIDHAALPPTDKPISVKQALAIRRLAIAGLTGWTNQLQIARWQAYWMDCCRSTKCDYLFSALQSKSELKEFAVNREKDLAALMKPFQPVWGQLERTETKAAIKFRIYLSLRFLLRRHAWLTALKVLPKSLWRYFKFFDGIPLLVHFAMVRLFGAIVVGFLPFFERNTWDVAYRIGTSSERLFILFALAFVAFAYFFYACYGVIEGNVGKALFRGAITTIVAAVVARLVAALFVRVMAPTYRPGADLNDQAALALIFAGVALVLGIIIQIFWEEKTIAEPL